MAVRYGSTAIVADARPKNMKLPFLYLASKNVDGLRWEITNTTTSRSATIYLPDNSIIRFDHRVSNATGENTNYIDTSVRLAPRLMNQISGLCGPFSPVDDRNASLGIQYVNGTWTANKTKITTEVISAWQVPSASNVLLGNIVMKPPAVGANFTFCAATKANPALGAYVAPPVSAPNRAPPNASANVNCQAPALSYCTGVFAQIEGCFPVVGIATTKAIIADCAKDLALTESYSVADHFLEFYLEECHTVANLHLTQNASALLVSQATAAMKEFGLGSDACPKNCSGRGECTNHGCSCQKGYFGYDCSSAGDDTLDCPPPAPIKQVVPTKTATTTSKTTASPSPTSTTSTTPRSTPMATVTKTVTQTMSSTTPTPTKTVTVKKCKPKTTILARPTSTSDL